MLRIRMIEQAIAREYKRQEMRCPVHLSIGQEAAAVGICAALSPADKMVSTHRGHAHYLAKGGSLKALIGELYGKVTGCSRGNGGSMHLIDLACGFWGSTSIVGGTIPIGAGLAFADKINHKNTWTVICIGDAAIEEGVFHEVASFVALHQLRVIFLCENNKYSCFTHIKDRQPERDDLKLVALAHRLQYQYAVNDTTHGSYQNPHDVEAAARMIMGAGRPGFIEVPTWRYVEHCGPDNDDHLGYRDERVNQFWMMNDPVRQFNNPDDVKMIEAEIQEAFYDAQVAPPPTGEEGKFVYATADV